MTGYLHEAYAASLAEFGEPRTLPRSGGRVLIRAVPGTPHRDGLGCYPVFACADWEGLEADLEELGSDLLCVSLVTDPFGAFGGLEFLRRCFRDVARPFKNHFVVDLARDPGALVAARHRRQVRRGLRAVTVEVSADPLRFADEWLALYTVLVARHRIRGIPAFSPRALVAQLTVPGLTMLRAAHEEVCVGMTLWYTQGEVAYYHLGAYSPAGYGLRASFALFWFALEHFAGRGLRWLSLGAGAGVEGAALDGLSEFKRGWASGTRPVYFCGRIFDRAAYAEMTREGPDTGYFPAYRRGEFG